MNIEILFALRTLHKVTKAPPLEDLQFSDLNKSYRKLILKTFKKNIVSKYLFFLEIFRIYIFILLKKDFRGTETDMILMYCTHNQERQINYIKKILPDHDYLELNLKGSNPYNIKRNINLKDFTTSFKAALELYNLLYKKYDAVDLKNFILFMGMYVQSRIFFERLRPKALIVANDHSVTPIAFAAAARSLGIKTIYIQHAHVSHVMPALRFNTAILDGECALDIYKKLGNIDETEILYRGIEGISKPMDTSSIETDKKLNVGLFTNICEEEKLFDLINALLQNERIKSVLLREHPAFPLNLSRRLPEKAHISRKGRTLWEDVECCDFIIGGNSSFHLSVLKYGKPTALYNDLDYLEYDEYGFIKHNICYEIREKCNIDLKEISYFYNSTAWQENFRYFDAGYLKSQESFNKEIRHHILKSLLN